MDNKTKLSNLKQSLEKLYLKHKAEMLFHGWHHIVFTSKKAVEFANGIQADAFIAESCALTHDLNYIVQPNSEPEIGKDLREKILLESGYSNDEIGKIESVVMETHTKNRGEVISEVGKAVSDADTLFKSLPITPIIFASKFITQNKIDVIKLARKIREEQNPLMEKGIYFYTPVAKEKYLNWAKVNLELWNNVSDALKDEDVKQVLSIANKLGVI